MIEYFNFSDLLVVAPEIFLVLCAFGMLLASVYAKGDMVIVQFNLALISLLAAGVVLFFSSSDLGRVELFGGMVVSSNYVVFAKFVVILGSVAAVFMSMNFYRESNLDCVGEFAALLLLAVVGMMLMVASDNFIALYVGLEMQSFCLYILAATNRNNLRSSEAGIKYFVLGSLSSGVFLYGCSFIYGYAGSLDFTVIRNLYAGGTEFPVGALFGMILIIVAFCFKVSAVPFHMWAPDVYQGAPTPVTAFFASVAKAAAVMTFARLLLEPFVSVADKWQQVIIFVSVVSMFVGALGALRQLNIKRLMAYSSIGHVGYLLIGVAAGNDLGVQSVLVYTAIYMSMSLGMFACIMMLKGRSEVFEDIRFLSGLKKTNPMMAIAIAIFMLSMAGIPPFAGFFGKMMVFWAAVESGLYVLAVLGGLASVISAFYYLRIVKIMFFDESAVSVESNAGFELKFVASMFAVVNLLMFLPIAGLLALVSDFSGALF